MHTILTLELAARAHAEGDEGAPAFVTEALEHARRANEGLRELSHGILPAELTIGGLRAGVELLVSRMPLPVVTHVSVGRLPSVVEATAYFVVAEALTNIVKHARATSAEVCLDLRDGRLRIAVRDDGVGRRPGGRKRPGRPARPPGGPRRPAPDRQPDGAGHARRSRDPHVRPRHKPGGPDMGCRVCHTPGRPVSRDDWGHCYLGPRGG